MITEKRTAEVEDLLVRLRQWAAKRDEVMAVGLLGSWAHSDARMDSDVDLVVLTTYQADYIEDEGWVRELGGPRLVSTRCWGPMTERRFVLPSGLEVEMGFAPPSGAATDPLKEGTRRVVEDGMSIVYDPEGMLTRLAEASRS